MQHLQFTWQTINHCGGGGVGQNREKKERAPPGRK